MTFKSKGELIYQINPEEKLQIIYLTYTTKGDTIITDQPSHRKIEKTKYKFEDENTLVLEFATDEMRFPSLFRCVPQSLPTSPAGLPQLKILNKIISFH